MEIQVDIEWPSSVPLPFFEFSGEPRNATAFTTENSTVIDQRNRFEKSYVGLNVDWVLTPGQFDAFKAFFQDDLGNGTASFKMELRYPLNSNLTWWQVRFIEDYEAFCLERFYRVRCSIDLVQKLDPIEEATF